MIVYLLRHGIALDIGEAGIESDAGRPLSPQGRRRTRAAGRGLARLDCRPRRVLSSPLTRARQTADIAARILAGTAGVVECTNLLLPPAPPRIVAAWLASGPDVPTLLVGHMPHLAEIASYLLCGRTTADIRLRKAGACCLSFAGRVAAGNGRLEWLLPPAVLRRLGAGRAR